MTVLNDNPDARAWAGEFMVRFGGKRDEIDFDLMLCWFANAIMCGYDHAQRKQTSPVPAISSDNTAKDGSK